MFRTPRFTRLLLSAALMLAASQAPAERPRLAVLTDIGGDPDEQQSLVRVLVYANEFETEALIASAAGTPGELKESITRAGWGGQFRREPEGRYRDLNDANGIDPRHTVSRWRPAFQGDFARRLEWCQPVPSEARP